MTTKKAKVDIIKEIQNYIVEVSQQDTCEGIAQWSTLGKYEKLKKFINYENAYFLQEERNRKKEKIEARKFFLVMWYEGSR